MSNRLGFSLIGMMGVIVIIWILLFIAAPSVHRAQINRDMAAMKTITALQTAEVQYFAQYGKYAASLTELAPSMAETGEESGYKFVVAGTATGYTISATPVAFGTTGERTFFTDESLIIRFLIAGDGSERD